MKKKYSGILSSYAHAGLDLRMVEKAIGLPTNTLTDITFEVTVTISGEFIAQTYWQPAEYPELSDVEIDAIYLDLPNGEIPATKEQIRELARFLPDAQEWAESYWSLVKEEQMAF